MFQERYIRAYVCVSPGSASQSVPLPVPVRREGGDALQGGREHAAGRV